MDESYEDFLKRLESLKRWISKRPRPAHSWMQSLQDWSEAEFNKEYDKYYKK